MEESMREFVGNRYNSIMAVLAREVELDTRTPGEVKADACKFANKHEEQKELRYIDTFESHIHACYNLCESIFKNKHIVSNNLDLVAPGICDKQLIQVIFSDTFDGFGVDYSSSLIVKLLEKHCIDRDMSTYELKYISHVGRNYDDNMLQIMTALDSLYRYGHTPKVLSEHKDILSKTLNQLFEKGK